MDGRNEEELQGETLDQDQENTGEYFVPYTPSEKSEIEGERIEKGDPTENTENKGGREREKEEEEAIQRMESGLEKEERRRKGHMMVEDEYQEQKKVEREKEKEEGRKKMMKSMIFLTIHTLFFNICLFVC